MKIMGEVGDEQNFEFFIFDIFLSETCRVYKTFSSSSSSLVYFCSYRSICTYFIFYSYTNTHVFIQF